jgi:predicted HicB family RNase H-like nuclease
MKEYSKGTVNFTVSVPDDLHERLVKAAQDRGVSRNSIVVAGIEREIKSKGKEGI